MAQTQKKNLSKPDETRSFPRGKMEVVKLDGTVFAKATFEPGWRWSEHVKPIAGTPTCQVNHVGFVVSGRMRIVMDAGGEVELGPGDFFVCPPGHDAWTVGDEACVAYDFTGGATYALKA